MYKFGNGWTSPEVKEEYNAIFKDIFTTPKYCHLYIVKSIESAADQFFHFGTGDVPAMGEGTAPYLAITGHYPLYLKQYLGARQQLNLLNFGRIAVIQNILFGISLFLSMCFLFFHRVAGKFKWIILFIFLALVINALVCGSLGTVVERFQTRVIWLLPLPLILVMANREIFIPFIHKLFRNDL